MLKRTEHLFDLFKCLLDQLFIYHTARPLSHASHENGDNSKVTFTLVAPVLKRDSFIDKTTDIKGILADLPGSHVVGLW